MASVPPIPPAGPGVLGGSGQWLGMAGSRALAIAVAGLVTGVAVTAPLVVSGTISFGGSGRSLGVYACPDGRVKLADIPVGQRVLVTGVNADGSWLQIDFPAPAIQRAWVRAQPFTPQGSLTGLPIVTCTSPISAQATPTPTAAPTATSAPTATPTPGPTPTSPPTGSPTPTPGPTPTPAPPPTAGPTSRPTGTPAPTATPTPRPTRTPTPPPTATPTAAPTATPAPPVIASVKWDQDAIFLPGSKRIPCDPTAPHTVNFLASLIHNPAVVEVDLMYQRPSDTSFSALRMTQSGDDWRTSLTTSTDPAWGTGQGRLTFYVVAIDSAKNTAKWPASGANPSIPVLICPQPTFSGPG